MAEEQFTFGVPLIGREAAGDWDRIEALLDLTIRSLLAQSDGDFRVIIAGHDRPRCADSDPRISFLRAGWPARAPEARNLDGGRKKHAIKERVLANGGGLLMFVDADDWLDVRVVESVRKRLQPRHSGAVITTGRVVDARTLQAAWIPDAELFDGGFDRVCGSSTLVRLIPDAPEPLRRDPYAVLHEHNRFTELARHHGLDLLELEGAGCYVVNTAENHSELHGPFADWRGEFCRTLNRIGRRLDHDDAERFGLGLDVVQSASERLFGRRWSSQPAAE